MSWKNTRSLDAAELIVCRCFIYCQLFYFDQLHSATSALLNYVCRSSIIVPVNKLITAASVLHCSQTHYITGYNHVLCNKFTTATC
ncbi:hypothetical protein GDO81_025763 [Engystomops pustulosus]|uniref:Uncharacterized protein n=1 Tax=Engystomops pustulosus TaxID=76066 RepID=A0AAV6Z6J2_ENGPU|nr:hypothetical protein GDO81_025763 [Engystomops pustulosus]